MVMCDVRRQFLMPVCCQMKGEAELMGINFTQDKSLDI